ncbi:MULTISPECIES: DUF3551 domain-containing protein [unclassified Bradyrhizobium]|uniref:DUF3551 domain-containing protein n=1 Tax=unclassified Bradyrhizobium TaxID=2631580 RepID=UPI0028E8CE20|nr:MULTISPECIES: DUF3551 domain-containing protein [unclassified Bradyrhizobium]
MRKFALTVLVSAALLASGAAHAQTYDPNFPVCLHTYGPNGYIDCRYQSIEACKFNAAGRSAGCEINPYFTATERAPRPGPRRPR